MGGDHAPAAIIAGAHRAVAAGHRVILCGTPAVLATSDLPGLPSDQAVGMADDPIAAMRRSPEASVRVAARTVAISPGSALLSAGSTGATVAAALLEMGRVDGCRRPVIAARLPCSNGGHAILVDAGADPDPHADAFLGYAKAGAAYARALGVHAPRIGLLNVGREPGKGNRMAADASVMLGDIDGFVGNVEPHDVLAGAVDVVVTDGFTGNIVLKTVEAASGGRLQDRADRAALVLGLGGTVLVAHGSATAEDVGIAIEMASRMAAGRISDQVRAALQTPPNEPAR